MPLFVPTKLVIKSVAQKRRSWGLRMAQC